jgi:hypothetical protein
MVPIFRFGEWYAMEWIQRNFVQSLIVSILLNGNPSFMLEAAKRQLNWTYSFPEKFCTTFLRAEMGQNFSG